MLDWDYQEGLWQAITQIEAQGLLLELTVEDYPWMKKDARRKLHREWHRKAYPRTHENTERLTTTQLAERLKAALNG